MPYAIYELCENTYIKKTGHILNTHTHTENYEKHCETLKPMHWLFLSKKKLNFYNMVIFPTNINEEAYKSIQLNIMHLRFWVFFYML